MVQIQEEAVDVATASVFASGLKIFLYDMGWIWSSRPWDQDSEALCTWPDQSRLILVGWLPEIHCSVFSPPTETSSSSMATLDLSIRRWQDGTKCMARRSSSNTEQDGLSWTWLMWFIKVTGSNKNIFSNFTRLGQVLLTILTSEPVSDPKYEKSPTFKEFISFLVNTPVSQYDPHWKPMYIQCLPCHIQVIFWWYLYLEEKWWQSNFWPVLVSSCGTYWYSGAGQWIHSANYRSQWQVGFIMTLHFL